VIRLSYLESWLLRDRYVPHFKILKYYVILVVKSIGSLQVLRSITTNSVLYKHTPHTIGVMSWVRAKRRRKYLEQKMKDFEKTDEQIMSEEQLGRSVPEIEFRLPARETRPINEHVMNQLSIKPEVFLSKDEKTIICYHPPQKDYPEHFTKPCVGVPTLVRGVNKKYDHRLQSHMTDEEIKEGLELQEKDPCLWSADHLANLFIVKPEVVKLNLPLSKEQKEVERAERELVEGLSNSKRQRYYYLQFWARLKYVKETRGDEDAKRFKAFGSIMTRPTISAPSLY